MAAFGGGIIFIFFLFFAYLVELYLQMSKVMKTQHIMSLISSCLIRIRWKSPNLIQKGGSKYRVHQGYGCVWRRYRFCTFCFFVQLHFQPLKVLKTQRIMCLFSSCLLFHPDGNAQI